jgi:hypothetical protein
MAGYRIQWFPEIKIEPSAGWKTFVKTVMNLQVAFKAIRFFCNYAPSSFSRKCLLLWVGWLMMWVMSVFTIMHWNVNVNVNVNVISHSCSQFIYPHLYTHTTHTNN